MAQRGTWCVQVLLLIATAGISTVASAQTVARVDVTASGGQTNGPSSNPSVSADGRYVAFESFAANLVANDTNLSSDIFVKDRVTGAITRVSLKSDGTQATGDSHSPRITPDGRFVVFSSEAPLVDDDTNSCAPSGSCRDIYVHDRTTGTTTRASVASDGTQGDKPSDSPAISADGRYVVFSSSATNLVAGDTNGVPDIFLRDLVAGTTTRLSVPAGSGEANAASTTPSISSDGQIVLFTSIASNLDPTADAFPCGIGSDPCSRLYLLDRGTGDVSRLPLTDLAFSLAQASQTRVDFPAATLSADGGSVAFLEVTTSTPPGAATPVSAGIYAVYHRAAAHTIQLGIRDPTVSTGAPAVSADGRQALFCDKEDPLIPTWYVSIRDFVLNDTFALEGAFGPTLLLDLHDCGGLAMSGDGNVVVFSSIDADVVPNDGNGVRDIFGLNRDSDGDGIPDWREQQFGENPHDPTDASADPDGDGKTNLQEYLARTHPNGRFTRYLAEGVSNSFFETTIVGFNPNDAPALVQLRYLGDNGEIRTETITAYPHQQFWPQIAAPPAASFSTVIESDRFVAIERTVSWNLPGLGAFPRASHAEIASAQPSTTWYFAEGATHGGFDLFYLLQNPNDTAALVTITYLLPGGQPSIIREYTVAPQHRLTIRVDDEPGLGATDVSAKIVSTQPILAERSMYYSTPEEVYAGGTGGAGIPQPDTRWFVAEGATGGFFDLFILVGNPSTQDADVIVTYLLPDGSSFDKTYHVAKESRLTISVDGEDPRLAATSVSAIVSSSNAVPIVVERAMWWPSPNWYEGHVTAATNATGATWVLAAAASMPTHGIQTYLLVANPADTVAHVTFDLNGIAPSETSDYGLVTVTCTKTIDVLAHSRFTAELHDVCPGLPPEYVRMGGTIHSDGAEIVAERSTYISSGLQLWKNGASTLLTKMP